ncbi:MAG: sarcosine oxidase subunit gamma [Bosea sp. (in: a-proteobacteria)]
MSQRYASNIVRLPMIALFEARGTEAGLSAALSASGLELPSDAHRVASQAMGATVLRLGSRRVLIMAEASSEVALGKALEVAFATVPDADIALVSDMFTAFEVSGAGALDILAQGAPLDLSDTSFPVGHGAGTELWATTVVLIRKDGPEPHFRIIVERSYAGFIEDWLNVASGGKSTLKPGVMISPPPPWKPA